MANAAAIGYLELNIKGFEQALTAAKRALTVFAAGMAAMKGMEFLKDGVKDAINFGNAMHHASQAAGRMDPGSFLIIQKAMENIGMSADQAQASIREFVQTGRPIQSIFGNAGNYTAALQNATQQYGAQAKVLSENASKFAKVFELLQAVGGKVREFFLSMGAQFLKPLQALLETLNRIDLATIGAKFGEQFAKAVNILNGALANNSLGRIISAGFEVGVALYNAATDRMLDVFLAGALGFAKSISSIVVSINWGNVGKHMANSMVDILMDPFVMAFRALILAIDKFQEGFGYFLDKLPGQKGNYEQAQKRTEEHQRGLEEFFKASKASATFNVGPLLNASTSHIAPAIKAAMSEASEKIGKLTDSPAVKAAKENLEKLAAEALKTGEALARSAPEKLTGYPGMKADPYSVIADSLAKVGGGGGAMRVGMTIEEKQLYEQKNATRILTDIAVKLDKTPIGKYDIPTMQPGTN